MKKRFGVISVIGKRLRQLRKQHNLSQKQLADLLGTSASCIGMYEQGRREPDHSKLSKLCRYFGVPTDYFIDEDYPANGPFPTASSEVPAAGKAKPQELSEILEQMQNSLMQQEGLMFHGTPLDEDDVRKVIEAIRIGTSVAMMDHRRRKDEEKTR